MKYSTIVVGRNGESMAGMLMTRALTIQSSFGVRLSFKADRIYWVHFKNPPFVAMDEIWAEPDDRVRGRILGRSIRFQPAGEKARSIAYSKIHTLILNQMKSR